MFLKKKERPNPAFRPKHTGIYKTMSFSEQRGGRSLAQTIEHYPQVFSLGSVGSMADMNGER